MVSVGEVVGDDGEFIFGIGGGGGEFTPEEAGREIRRFEAGSREFEKEPAFFLLSQERFEGVGGEEYLFFREEQEVAVARPAKRSPA